MLVYSVHRVAKEARRRYQIPWNWSYGQMLAPTWVLVTRP